MITTKLQLKNTQRCARDLVSVLVEILEVILVRKEAYNSAHSEVSSQEGGEEE